MKYQRLLFLFFLLTVQQAMAQAPNWTWLRGSRDPLGLSHTSGISIATDHSGNEYVTGYLESNYNVVGPDTIFKANGGLSDAFLVKYDAAGNVVWAKGIGGTNSGASGYSVTTDLASNVYITGFFGHGTMIFGADTLTNDSTYFNMFIARLDPAGNCLWARKSANSNYCGGYSVATDPFGNAYVVGTFISPAVTFGSYTLTTDSPGYENIFLVKYDAAGNVIWARSPRGFNGNVWSIATDPGGNIYVTGNFVTGKIIFGTDTLHNDSTRTGDICVAKYDSSGAVLWAKSATGKYTDYANALATDGNGYLYVTGYFQSDTIRFGSITLTSDSMGGHVPNMFVARYDAVSGNALWVEHPKSYWSTGNGVASDAAGNAYVTGVFNSPQIIFGTDTLFGGGGSFVVKYDGTGTEVWAKGGGYFRAGINAIALDAANDIYLGGGFNGDSVLVLGADSLRGSPAGGGDLLVVKLSYLTATTRLSTVFTNSGDLAVYPVPNNGVMNIACAGSGYTGLNIYDALGTKIYTQPLDPAQSNVITKVIIGAVPKGVYLVQATGPAGAVTKQIVVR